MGERDFPCSKFLPMKISISLALPSSHPLVDMSLSISLPVHRKKPSISKVMEQPSWLPQICMTWSCTCSETRTLSQVWVRSVTTSFTVSSNIPSYQYCSASWCRCRTRRQSHCHAEEIAPTGSSLWTSQERALMVLSVWSWLKNKKKRLRKAGLKRQIWITPRWENSVQWGCLKQDGHYELMT